VCVIDRHWHAKDTRPCLICYVPETQGSENMSVNDLRSLAPFVKLGIAPQPYKNLARRYN